MNTIVRNVGDIDAEERRWLERALGQPLQNDQQVVIRVLEPNVVPCAETRQAALRRASEIAQRGRQNVAATGAKSAEIEETLNEAIHYGSFVTVAPDRNPKR